MTAMLISIIVVLSGLLAVVTYPTVAEILRKARLYDVAMSKLVETRKENRQLRQYLESLNGKRQSGFQEKKDNGTGGKWWNRGESDRYEESAEKLRVRRMPSWASTPKHLIIEAPYYVVT